MSVSMRPNQLTMSTRSSQSSPSIARFFVLLFICAAVMLCAALPTASAANLVVTPPSTTNCKSGIVYNTIAAAVTAASKTTPQTIYICPGTYTEQVTITKSLTLTGVSSAGTMGASASGANNPVILAPNPVSANATRINGNPIAAQIAVVPPTATTPITVNINNLTIDGSNNGITGCAPDFAGIYYQNANGIVNHNVARNQELSSALFGCQTGLAIFVEGGSGGSAAVTVENNSVHDYQKNGITAHGSATVTVSGNYVVGVGPTNQIAQNGIEVAFGATGGVSNNIVSDDIFINDPNCCTSASGILVFESGGISGTSQLTIGGNTVSNTQGPVVLFGDTNGAADFISVTSNKITTTPAIPGFQIDGIDMCGNNDTAKSNTVLNSSGSGVHIDSLCTEASGTTGNMAVVQNNTVNEACAGVLLGTVSGNSVSSNATYNVVQATFVGDACPAGTSVARRGRLQPNPFR